MLTNKDSEAIDALDLSPIKMKLMHVESGEGWTRAKAEAVEVEYRRFLYLTKEYPNEQIAPSVDVDVFWHYHILDTMKYARDCEHLFGYFLHHYPYMGLDDDSSPEDRIETGARTAELYAAEFGQQAETAGPQMAPVAANHAWCAAPGNPARCAAPGEQAANAWCAAPGKQMDTAWCAAPGKQMGTAWCAAPGKKETAWCAAPGKHQNAVWCAAPAKRTNNAWCASPAKNTDAAWCAAPAKQIDIAWCAAPGKKANTAWCAAPAAHAKQAWCAAPGKSTGAAWCAAPGKSNTPSRSASTVKQLRTIWRALGGKERIQLDVASNGKLFVIESPLLVA